MLLEGWSRLLDIGDDLPLFIDTPDSANYVLSRPDLVRRYFPNSSNQLLVTMEANLLRKQKPDNGLRIFVQGGSSAAGYPYGLGASIAGLLDQKMKRDFPLKLDLTSSGIISINCLTSHLPTTGARPPGHG